MVQPGGQGMMAAWPSHRSRSRPRCASGWPPGEPSAGPSSPASPSATTGSSPTSPGTSPTALPLMRLRDAGSASTWGFAIYRASHDDYEKSVLPSGHPARHTPGSTRLHLRPLPRRHHRLARPATPDELTGPTTSAVRLPCAYIRPMSRSSAARFTRLSRRRGQVPAGSRAE
jgi:hypothetical protein